jgi:prophage regulatory protein
MPGERRITLLRKPAVEQETGLSGGMIDLRERRGEFPLRVPIGPRAVGWVASEVENWKAARVAERDDPGRAAECYEQRLPEPARRRRVPPK